MRPFWERPCCLFYPNPKKGTPLPLSLSLSLLRRALRIPRHQSSSGVFENHHRLMTTTTTGGGRGEQHTAVAAVSSTTGRFERAESSFRDRIPSSFWGRPEDRGAVFFFFFYDTAPIRVGGELCVSVGVSMPYHRVFERLEDVIDVEIVHPTWQKTRKDDGHAGWVFPDFDATRYRTCPASKARGSR